MQLELDEGQCCEIQLPDTPGLAVDVMRNMSGAAIGLEHIDSVRGSRTSLEAMQFWETALRKLGHVSIFAFATGEFLMIGPDGERVRATSLAAALQEMLQHLRLATDGREDA